MEQMKRRLAAIVEQQTRAVACPKCGSPSSTDFVDLVERKVVHTCRKCNRLWEASVEHAPA